MCRRTKLWRTYSVINRARFLYRISLGSLFKDSLESEYSLKVTGINAHSLLQLLIRLERLLLQALELALIILESDWVYKNNFYIIHT